MNIKVLSAFNHAGELEKSMLSMSILWRGLRRTKWIIINQSVKRKPVKL